MSQCGTAAPGCAKLARNHTDKQEAYYLGMASRVNGKHSKESILR